MDTGSVGRERYPEYDELFEDGRLEITVAHGYVEEENGRLLAEGVERLRRGFERLGFASDGEDRFRRSVADPETGRTIEVEVTLLHPGSAPTPEEVRDAFGRALGEREVVVYVGHARYGTGPDFDPKPSGRGNFVVDRTGGPRGNPHGALAESLRGAPRSMLPSVPARDGYQVLYFHACTTENYRQSLRDPATFPGHDRADTDLVLTTIPMRIGPTPDHALAFVETLVERRSIDSFLDAANAREAAYIRLLLETGSTVESVDGVDVERASRAIVADGFDDDRANRVRE